MSTSTAFAESGTSPTAVNNGKRTAPALYSSSHSDSRTLPDRIAAIKHALKAEDLAEILNVSKVTIFRRAKAGKIPSFRIGSAVRFDPKSVADWLRKQ